MPVFRAPGVFVEELAFRARAIEGVGTSTTAFVGPTRTGPGRAADGRASGPEWLGSVADFERLYGGPGDLALGEGVPRTNHLAHAVRAFFGEGGTRLCVSRVLGAGAAQASVEVSASPSIRFHARWPGCAGNGRITVREAVQPASAAALDDCPEGSLSCTAQGEGLAFHLKGARGWTAAESPDGDAVDALFLAAAGAQLLTLGFSATDGDGRSAAIDGLGLSPQHPRWIGRVLAAAPRGDGEASSPGFAIGLEAGLSPLALRQALLGLDAPQARAGRERHWDLSGGRDGAEPTAQDYALALADVAAFDGVAIVAAPGSSAYGVADAANPQAIAQALIAHAEASGAHRIAVLDTPPGLTAEQALRYRGLFDSGCAALYFPWVVVSNPLARPGQGDVPAELAVPPSGFLCGVYARCDAERGVHTAPANEPLRSALRFAHAITNAEQERLNPLGLNCLRELSGRGLRVWGARLMSSDPERRYVPDRRYLAYLQASMERGTRWVALERQGEALWARLRQAVEDFLQAEWRKGALAGRTAQEAFFVRCDRSTLTQEDLGEGRLRCLVGVALRKPAEFVVLQLQQPTADARG